MTYYFFDDSHIQIQSDLIRAPGPVEKLGCVLDSDQPDRAFDYDPFAGTVLPVETGFRAYVSTFHHESWEKGGGVAVCESADGLSWHEVPLRFQHDKEATPGQIGVEGLPADFHGYLKQPDVLRLPDGTYRMYVWAHGYRSKAPISRYIVMHSEDGYHFRLDDFERAVLYHPNELGRWGFEAGLVPINWADVERPILEPSQMLSLKGQRSNDSSFMYFDARTGIYSLYSVFLVPNPTGNPRQEQRDNARTLLRVIARRTSDDGFHFSPPELMVTPDAADPLDQQFYYMAVHRQDGWHIGLLGDYEVIEQTMDVQLGFSHDGRCWQRPARSPWIPRGDSYDAKNIQVSNSLLDAGDDWLLLYRAGSHLHNDRRRPSDCMALARFGKRRFLGLATGPNRDARLLTKPFILAQPEIRLDATVRDVLRAELCDIFGTPLPGYRREDCLPVQGDNRAHMLGWKDKTTHDYQYDPVSLRVEMTDATLYAIDC